MKKVIFATVVLGLVTAFVFAEMNHTIKSRPTAYWWHSGASYSTDPARMWAYEVEEYLENERTFVTFNANPICMDLD